MAKAVAVSEVLMSDEVAGNLEEGVEAIDDIHADEAAAAAAVTTTARDGQQDNVRGGGEGRQSAIEGAGMAGGVAAVGVGAAGASRAAADSRASRDIESGHGDGDDTAEEVPSAQQQEKKKSGRFGIVGNWASAVATAGKEYVASSILGDDLGEMLVAKLEKDEDSDSDDEDDKKKEGEQQQSKRKGLFRKKEG